MEKKDVILTVMYGMDKSFGATKALKNVGIEIYRNEIHGLIGENGSGKSTLSSIIAGMQKCDEGTMEYTAGGRRAGQYLRGRKGRGIRYGSRTGKKYTGRHFGRGKHFYRKEEEVFESGPIVNLRKNEP